MQDSTVTRISVQIQIKRFICTVQNAADPSDWIEMTWNPIKLLSVVAIWIQNEDLLRP